MKTNNNANIYKQIEIFAQLTSAHRLYYNQIIGWNKSAQALKKAIFGATGTIPDTTKQIFSNPSIKNLVTQICDIIGKLAIKANKEGVSSAESKAQHDKAVALCNNLHQLIPTTVGFMPLENLIKELKKFNPIDLSAQSYGEKPIVI